MTIRTVYDNQEDIIKGIIELHCPSGIDLDVTYGNGVFYRNMNKPEYRVDIDGQLEDLTHVSCSSKLPFDDCQFESVMFDPPFLTYIKNKKSGGSIMGKRFSGYWNYDELKDHYTKTFTEISRVLKPKGIMILKCQDIIHNHKLHPTHINAVGWVKDMFRIKDLFILPAKHRLPRPGKLIKQQHARVFHCYFMVFEKLPVKPKRKEPS